MCVLAVTLCVSYMLLPVSNMLGFTIPLEAKLKFLLIFSFTNHVPSLYTCPSLEYIILFYMSLDF